MSEQAGRIASTVAGVIDRAMSESERSLWAKDHRIGVSDIGHCREYVRRMLTQQEFSDEQNKWSLAALVGTSIGDHIEDAMVRLDPDAQWVKQDTVTVPLRWEDVEINLPGHPDLYNRNTVLDFKSKNGLGVVRRGGSSQNERYQLSLYARALILEGKVDPDDLTLALVFIDRSGSEREPHVEAWTYDPSIVQEAEEWLGDVLYAITQGEEASRDRERSWCYACCPFATACRGEDTDAEGLIEDPEIIKAVQTYVAAGELEKKAKADKDAARAALVGISGSTGTHVVRPVEVAPSSYEVNRAGYVRTDIRPVRKRKGTTA